MSARHGVAGSIRAEDVGQDLRAGHSVDRAVVDLGELRDATATEPFDHVQLPQRPPAVEWSRHDPPDLGRELPVVAGRGERDVADVEVDVEVRVLDPVRLIESERHLDEPPTGGRHEVQMVVDQRLQVVEPHRLRRRFEQRQATDVSVGGAALDVQEERVEA